MTPTPIIQDEAAIAAMSLDQKLALASALRESIAREHGPQGTGVAAEASGAEELLTVHEAAAMLKVTPRWLYRHAAKVPFSRKLSRKVLRFSRPALLRWLARQRT
jgi:hypothetical protein